MKEVSRVAVLPFMEWVRSLLIRSPCGSRYFRVELLTARLPAKNERPEEEVEGDYLKIPLGLSVTKIQGLPRD